MMSLHREAGVVMITALLFLFVMTLLGVAAMQSSLLQERMAGHLRDSHMAFQAAESALRGGEAWLDSSATNRATAEGNLPLATPAAWDGSGAMGSVALNPEAGLFADPQFHLGPPQFVRSPESMDLNQAQLLCQRLYPVTARASGGTATSVVILRSTYDPPMGGWVSCPNP
ncbi:hypothetical protein D5085_09510 [Ectothiorhodospiraceae bacterium BW-2]|nr:hypothetical protein D5085_09510 [Ectothiorhodospiraceae bacterium BW-2]